MITFDEATADDMPGFFPLAPVGYGHSFGQQDFALAGTDDDGEDLDEDEDEDDDLDDEDDDDEDDDDDLDDEEDE